MNIIRKDATITPTGGDDDFPGTFEVVLSAPTLDRDGDTLKPEDWKQPLPEHITFDSDHGMSVATTVGSGVPTLNDAGELVVSGTFSSLPRAQEVRTLVKEGHIRTTSVAFMSEEQAKDGKSRSVRELLNGAFVAIPSNREALVMAAKSVKAGARNSSADAALIQSMHDAACTLGADCSGAKSFIPEGTKGLEPSTDNEDDAKPDAAPVTSQVEVNPDEDKTSEPAPTDAAAPAKAAAPAEVKAADDDELQTRVRALQMSANTYIGD